MTSHPPAGCADLRARELFPLPLPADFEKHASLGAGFGSLSHACRRRLLRRWHKHTWFGEAIGTLNELSGQPFSEPPSIPRNAGQREALSRLQGIFESIPRPPEGLTPAGAYAELRGSATRYTPTEPSKTARYAKDLVSWPDEGTTATPVVDLLTGADREIACDWSRIILKDSGQGRPGCPGAGREVATAAKCPPCQQDRMQAKSKRCP